MTTTYAPGFAFRSALYRDHGLVVKDDPNATHFYAYVGNVKDFNLRAMVLVRGYSEKAPVPSLGHDKLVFLKYTPFL